MGELAVFVGAEDTNIQVIAGIFEIIRIAAVKRRLLFRCEYEPDVGVALEAVKMVLGTLIKRDDVAPESRLLTGFIFNFRGDFSACGEGFFCRCSSGHSRGYTRGELFDAHQEVELPIGAPLLICTRFRVKT